MFGAIVAVSPQELGGKIGAPESVGHPAGASLATLRRRRHCILPCALGADFGSDNFAAPEAVQ